MVGFLQGKSIILDDDVPKVCAELHEAFPDFCASKHMRDCVHNESHSCALINHPQRTHVHREELKRHFEEGHETTFPYA